jgi:hypothetical protein
MEPRPFLRRLGRAGALLGSEDFGALLRSLDDDDRLERAASATAVARDGGGHQTTFAAIDVTVSNGVAPPPSGARRRLLAERDQRHDRGRRLREGKCRNRVACRGRGRQVRERAQLRRAERLSTTSGASGSRGTIDEVRIYNRALGQAEIQSDMTAPLMP